MLLSSVIIVLREVLEAALLFSILIALAKHSAISNRWMLWSLALGLVGAVIYGMNLSNISEWFDGVGQEVANAFIQLFIYAVLVIYMGVQVYFKDQAMTSKYWFLVLMIVITSLAMTREGAEILLYFFSATHRENHYVSVLIGMIIGASIGVSVGFLFYYLLVSLRSLWALRIGLALLILVSAGMVSQASLLLIQADWLPAQMPLWDTSTFLSEKTAMGQLMYALIGYEATPTAIQASLYLFGLLFPVGIIALVNSKNIAYNKVAETK